MQFADETLHLSATDLSHHLGCRHLTTLDRAHAEGRRKRPYRDDPTLEVLIQRGLDHEKAYIDHLRAEGKSVTTLRDVEGESAIERTKVAMHSAADVIVQPAFAHDRWQGRADILLKVDTPSALGAWSYEAADTKLAQNTRGGTILQLCLYSELLEHVQGVAPAYMHVVKPGDDFPREPFRFADFRAYYNVVKRRLEAICAHPEPADTYPLPVPQCDICSWWTECNAKRHADDHPCLIAGAQSQHIVELERHDIDTLEAFAERDTPLPSRPERGAPETYDRLHQQARVQLKGRREERPVHEFWPLEEGRGFQLLPEPSAGDVFFDIESDRFYDGGGLEYLLGVAVAGDGGLKYEARWAITRAEERRAFEAFIDSVMARWEADPAMHIYHFGGYETGAVKRLMGRHATRMTEVDSLLRGGRFVDLHAVTRQGLRASVERYGLKDLEAFFGFTREVELRDASAALRRVECELEMSTKPDIPAADRDVVQGYNREDCLATLALRDWLEERRAVLIAEGHDVPRPELVDGDASEGVSEHDERIQVVFDELVDGIDLDDPSPEERARWTLAHLLAYFRREDRVAWWEFFRHHALEFEELLDERKAVAGLEFVGEVAGGTKRCPFHAYRFPYQEAALKRGDKLHEVGGDRVGEVVSLDASTRELVIKKMQKSRDHHAGSVFAEQRVAPEPLDGSLLELGRWVAANGVDVPGEYRAARDLLLKLPPRLSAPRDVLRRPGVDVVDDAIQLASELDHGTLAIQGPPGTGKSYIGARIIVALARSGARVGVTAVSHNVIWNLLEEAVAAGLSVDAVHKGGKTKGDAPDCITLVESNQEALDALHDGNVVGGTAWLWAREDAVDALDYLIVDEAGQMSLAHVLAAARSAKNLVLLGDPQQLQQPQKGAHPEGAEVAALVHLLDGAETMPVDKGLFLEETWRLHPSICAFTSEVFYEGRLSSREGLERQAVVGETAFAGSGLFYVPVSHEGNRSRSVEEVEAVEGVVESLLGARWRDKDGVVHDLGASDILVVAPYNAQVGALTERLPGMRVGTVDRFQGQEAPVVIYSMVSSSAEDAPRGMEFLYSPNRLNVATSRARCVCVLVGSPMLFEPECRTPAHMRWANGVCRYGEMGRETSPEDKWQ